MREKLNSNPLVQMGVIAILLVAVAIFFLSSKGGGEEEGESGGSLSATSAPVGEGPAPSPSAAPLTSTGMPPILATRPVPQPVVVAWKANRTVALLFVHNGGIDDDLVELASGRLNGMPGVTTFVISASEIADYAAITEGVGVDRVPALVVLRPKRLDQSVPTASVSYGFQDGDAIVQAVIDAGYKGPTLEYHP
jgi:hypothetical protein